jgi:hypothetical protein
MTLRIFLMLAVALALCSGHPALADDSVGKPLELLDESHGPVPSQPCAMPNCAIVIAIRHHLGVEPVASEDGPGVYFQQEVDTDLDPTPPLELPLAPQITPPLVQSTTLEKETQLWQIELRMQDGSVQTVQQDFEPLFPVGTQVVVDGDQVREWR